MTNEEIEGQLQHLATKADIDLLRADFYKAQLDFVKWFVMLMGLQTTITLGAVYFLLQHVK